MQTITLKMRKLASGKKKKEIQSESRWDWGDILDLGRTVI